MRYLKKVLSLKDKNFENAANATAVFKDGTWQFKISLNLSSLSGDGVFCVIFLNGEYKKFYSTNFSFEGEDGEIAIGVFNENGCFAFGKTPSSNISITKFENYVESKANNTGTDYQKDANEKYDDYAIATQNYYEGEVELDLSKNYGDAGRKAEGGKGSKEEDCRNVAYNHEKGDVLSGGIEKRPLCSSADNQSGGVFSENQRGYFDEKRQEFLKLFLENERDYTLNEVIYNGRFVKVTEKGGDKFYLFGTVGEEFLKPDYILYAVLGKRGDKKEGFENAVFIPTDFFDFENGYFVTFQSAKTGKKIDAASFK